MNERDRIEYLMNLYGLTPSQFSDKTGIQRASVSHILSNRNKPSLEILLKIYHAFQGVELAWLVAGEGDPPTLEGESVDNQSAEGGDVVGEAQMGTNMLFSFMEDDAAPRSDAKQRMAQSVVVNKAEDGGDGCVVGRCDATCDNRSDEVGSLSIGVCSDKRIKEIKIFYNNGTYETFLPEK